MKILPRRTRTASSSEKTSARRGKWTLGSDFPLLFYKKITLLNKKGLNVLFYFS